jgi:acyl transferase domain-containing protein/aryl carrier-like protein
VASRDEIERRLVSAPGHTFVLEEDGAILGVLYTQRVASVESLRTARYRSLATLHDPDGPVVQLIGIAVSPDRQSMGLADELIGHVLERARGLPGLTRAAAITRCRRFDAASGVSMEAHVARRDPDGTVADPGLRFHEAHGARIRGIVAGYRPEDEENLGAGVLVEYDLARRQLEVDSREAPLVSVGARSGDPRDVAESCIRAVLGPRRASAYSPVRTLRDMGLDSLDLAELATLLRRGSGLSVDPTVFFAHPTPEALGRFLEARSQPSTAAVGTPIGSQDPDERAQPGPVQGHRVTDAPEGALAVVGLACRFPGAPDAEAYWFLLDGGRNGISEGPAERWDLSCLGDLDPAEAAAIRMGGFLDDVAGFDADFFGLSPREARRMDPQQRILLETAWHALESAAIDPRSLAAAPVGVFIGISSHDYELLQVRRGDPGAFGPHFASGTSVAVAAGRLAYTFGLQGPALSIDTACSSSLVAVHTAARSLLGGECQVALAGGVSLLLAPEMSLAFSRARMLAPDGRCKTFDASADGYVRGEGCGIVVLKRLEDAQASGDRILAVLRGSATNQDGASNGLTAPNGLAQEDVLRQALGTAGVAPADVSYVEAHGTGTSLGDPVEVRSLGRVYGEGRDSEEPLVIGSVKTMIGHLEAAAGIAGLIKVVLALKHRRIPPHLHLTGPNPLLSLDAIPAVVPTTARDWDAREGRPRRAAVSSFGFSGTNAHVVLEEAPASRSLPKTLARSVHVLTLSGASEAAVGRLATDLAARVDEATPNGTALADLCFTTNTGRAHLDHRLALVTDSLQELGERLRGSAVGSAPGILRGRCDLSGAGGLAFLFTGQGSQYAGMGRELFEAEPGFRRTLEQCQELLQAHLDRPLLSVLFPADGAPPLLDQTRYTQPAVFALEYALAALWRSWGIEPVAVMGHSVGEYVAACIAGVFGLEDGLKLIAARGRLMQELDPDGEMVVLDTDPSRVEPLLTGRCDVAVAALNGPRNTVVSGARPAVRQIVGALRERGVRAHELPVSHAFHSPLMEPMLDEFERVASEVTFAAPHLVLVSNVTGRPVSREEPCGPGYWRRHVREPVRFAQGLSTLLEMGHRTFLEAGPAPTLISMGQAAVPDSGATWLASLRPGRDEQRQVLESLASLHVQGRDVDWAAVHRGARRRKVELPAYPFEHRRYWFAEASGIEASARTCSKRPGGEPGSHPLLGQPMPSPLRELLFTSRVAAVSPAWMEDHRVHGEVILPATAFVDTMLAAGVAESGRGSGILEGLEILEPLVLAGSGDRALQTVVIPGSESARVEIFSRDDEGSPKGWRKHAVATVRLDGGPERREEAPTDLSAARGRCADTVHVSGFYRRMEQAGIDYGPSFRGIAALWAGEREALGSIVLDSNGATHRHTLHPALLDSSIQVVFAAAPDMTAGEDPWLPMGLDRVRWMGPLPERLWSSAQLRDAAAGSETRTADVLVFDQAGRVVAEIEGLHLKRASRGSLLDVRRWHSEDWLHEITWRPVPRARLASATPSGRVGPWIVLGDQAGIGAGLVRRLRQRGEECVLVEATRRPGTQGAPIAAIDPTSREALHSVIDEARSTAGGIRGVVHLWSLDAVALGNESLGTLAEEQTRFCGSLLHLVQTLLRVFEGGGIPPLWIVTRGAQPVAPSGEGLAIAQSPVWGLARAIPLEHPELDTVCLDLDPGEGADESAMVLAEELEPGDPEDQIAFRGGMRYGARLVPRRVEGEPGGPLPASPVALVVKERGQLDNLRLEPVERRLPGPGEVEIRVSSTGLNFRDVLNVLGMYPGDAGPLGSECAGTIVTLGPGVTGWSIGDDVVALAPGSFRTFATASTELVVRRPPGLSPAAAATLPVAFLTADYALRHLAGMGAGDRVLIHAAAGGVGLAAVQLAQRAGAEVLATASTGKHDVLRSLGIRHVMNSRTLDFANEVKRRTGGEGVDIVLNSLAGDFIPKSLEVLRPGGCFLEIGKTGIWSREQVAAARNDVVYHPIYLGDVDPAALGASLRAVVADVAEGHLRPLPHREFLLTHAEEAFRYMAQARHVGKVVVSPVTNSVRPDGTYLITGGLGGLGLLVARWLVGQGAKRLVLVGRGAPSPTSLTVLSELETAGSEVVVARGDVSDGTFVDDLVPRLDAPDRPLRGVVHAAGVLRDGVLREQSLDRVEEVLAPKVLGAWNLYSRLRDRALDFFVGFSSVTSVLGAPGQAAYAAANAFLDGLAYQLRAEGVRALSINWGPWSDVGMAARLGNRDRMRWAQQGVGFIEPARGAEILEHVLRDIDRIPPQIAVLSVDWSRFRARSLGAKSPLLAEIDRPREGGLPAAPPPAAQSLLEELVEATVDRRFEIALDHVRQQVDAVLGRESADPLDPRRGLRDAGLDSLMAVELRNRLQTSLGRALPQTLVFDHPTLEALARHVLTHLPVSGVGSRPASPEPAAPPGAAAIAVIGLGCRFPGGVTDPESFWDLLEHGRDAITPVPSDRWDAASLYDPDPEAVGKTYTRHGGFLEGVDLFDPRFFGVTPREAASMDPQQRLLLEVSWSALEDAGQPPDRLMGTRTGVFVGICSSDYATLQTRHGGPGRLDAYFGTGNALSVAAGRLSYGLGLQGPSLAVDTACSSSLVAVHLACRSLRSGESRLALAGGVNLMLAPETTINFSRARMLAADGRCKTFDQAADGYVRSEGCGVVVLKRLDDALKDGDRVMAVIRGSAVNQDGRSSGLTAPNGPAQSALIRDALADAGVEAADVGYVEAHGTGTELGDPIELQALGAALGERSHRDPPLMVGSVKTNIGHLEAAAGVAGLIKVVLSLQRGEIPPHLHFERLNLRVSTSQFRGVIPRSKTPWPDGRRPRIAGVSAFGFSGTNAHVVVEASPRRDSSPAPLERSAHLLTLSARTPDALRALASRLEAHLATHPALSLSGVCLTAGAGRSHFAHRAAVLAGSLAELREELRALAAGRDTGSLRRGRVRTGRKPRVVLSFTSGIPPVGLGRELYETHPGFRGDLDRCDDLLEPLLGHPLLSCLYSDTSDEAATLDPGIGVPAQVALQVALSRLWASWGLAAAEVSGEGAGEYAAACHAGALTVEEALRLAARARGPEAPLLANWGSSSPPTNTGAEPGRERVRGEPTICVEVGLCSGDSESEQRISGLSPRHSAWRQLLASLGRLYVAGADIDWRAVHGPYAREFVSLPTYPFERERYWFDAETPDRDAAGPATSSPSRAGALSQVSPEIGELSETEAEERLIERLNELEY